MGITVLVIVIVVIVGLIAFSAFTTGSSSQAPAPEKTQEDITAEPEYQYTKIEALITPAELKFYKALVQATPSEYVVCPKVRIADVLGVGVTRKGNSKVWHRHFSKISQKHFDFVICNVSDMSFICAVELNDASHNRKDRVERDEFVRMACESANVTLHEVLPKQNYDIEELTSMINS
ncbi:hypothetical protein CTM97_16025 [Photobacterium phosphoreum]|uniref:DUF2726 domain-containing protein n=1 Tax=Photobacterium phosphoreum TaxID=659 RepID=A0A2T3JTD5_PHOPO|nr:DUF2726 domain-containing protein [Photobacterium phosphoreum]PSU21975.1 hypothetical protein CTM96_16645 [Photobacterium phosphoreum]PSU40176.1 hypothetical protein CTM97_16025 [Photobacterium phosphoreum]PSU52380.1 hypothetical protein C9J18_09560 [Photobacterium phosphoreum]